MLGASVCDALRQLPGIPPRAARRKAPHALLLSDAVVGRGPGPCTGAPPTRPQPGRSSPLTAPLAVVCTATPEYLSAAPPGAQLSWAHVAGDCVISPGRRRDASCVRRRAAAMQAVPAQPGARCTCVACSPGEACTVAAVA